MLDSTKEIAEGHTRELFDVLKSESININEDFNLFDNEQISLYQDFPFLFGCMVLCNEICSLKNFEEHLSVPDKNKFYILIRFIIHKSLVRNFNFGPAEEFSKDVDFTYSSKLLCWGIE